MICIDRASLQNIEGVCKRMLKGDINARIMGMDGDHPLKPLADAINGTLDLVDAFTRESGAAIEHCSQDKFHRPLLPQGMPGVFGTSASIINQGGARMRESFLRFCEIAALAEENSAAVNTIAAACEELSATNQEITRHAHSTVESSQQTSTQATELSDRVDDMSDALRDIQATVNMIENIAQQTHLLALNAMIEASRAGGKGTRFSVVANEVKDLAKSTSNATDQIKTHVTRIHQISERTSGSFVQIETSIKSIESSSHLIRNSLTHQVSATEEVSFHVSEVARNMETVTEKIQDLRIRR